MMRKGATDTGGNLYNGTADDWRKITRLYTYTHARDPVRVAGEERRELTIHERITRTLPWRELTL